MSVHSTDSNVATRLEKDMPVLKASGGVKFVNPDLVMAELRKRVDAYFEQTGLKRRDCWQMYLKTAIILTWFFSAYIALVFFVTNPYIIAVLAVLIGLSAAAIGFNIQHDGNHKGYSEKGWVNHIMALTLDLIGGSSYVWSCKHNTIHHTFTNVDGHDDDINLGWLGRLSPEQPRLFFHRFQRFYLWPLYGFLAMKWHWLDDFYNIAVGKIGNHKLVRPKGWDLVTFIAGKIVFFSLAIGIPMLLHPWWAVLSVYALASISTGLVISIVFQLAHCVQEASFPVVNIEPSGQGRMATEWAVHQLQTTVNFARNNKILGWFVGGLNYQVEHHLFHRICHIHYPALSKVVEQACQEYGLRYAANPTFFAALRSHYRFLRDMGQPTPAA